MHHHHPLSNAATSTSTATHAHQRRRKKRPNYGTRTVEVRRGYNGFGFTISGQQPCRLSCIVTNSPADQAGLRAGDFLISVNGLNVSKLPHETVVQLIGNSFGSIRMQIAENYYSDSSDEENAALMMQQQTCDGGAVALSASPGFLGGIAGTSGARAKPRYLHHKTKMHRLRNSPQKKRTMQHQLHRPQLVKMPGASTPIIKPAEMQTLRPLIEDLPLTIQQSNNTNVPKASPINNSSAMSKAPLLSSDVANVSAMVRVPTAALEYRAIVGYLGTIEMPKQISHSSKLQTVRSCIRKLRQEKRQPTTVLMTILPDCLRLQAASGNVLASYASERLNYVSSSSESENRFFGLVTSAVHTSQLDEDDDDDDDEDAKDDLRPVATSSNTGHISISNSCHVFVIDTKQCEHYAHVSRATEFRIHCTKDPISNLCLEFPNNSEYVVNLIRSMYTMRILPPATRHISDDYPNGVHAAVAVAAAAHSPQPSNHSEISTTTSNSDSGIGFHNDCTNISDRILVVDFPGVPEMRMRLGPSAARPVGIFNNFDLVNDKRLTVRAMPDPKTPPNSTYAQRRPNLLANFNMIKSPASSLTATRSCDDVLTLMERQTDVPHMPHVSMDDISLHSASTTTAAIEEQQFLHPSCLNGGQRKMYGNNVAVAATADTYALLEDYRTGIRNSTRNSSQIAFVPSKLSPQVFGLGTTAITKATASDQTITPAASTTTPTSTAMHQSLDFQAIDSSETTSTLAGTAPSPSSHFDLDTWSSLQDLHTTTHTLHHDKLPPSMRQLEATNSEPDLLNRALPNSNVSPFRRAWGQSSFRTPRTDKHARLSPHSHLSSHPQSPLCRSASMTASDNDVYIKSMHHGYIDELKQTQSQQHITGGSHQHNVTVSTAMPNRVAISCTNNTGSQLKMDTGIPQQPQQHQPQQQQQLANTEPTVTGVAAWGISFERLLEDPAGLHTFAEFLKKEFSAENIYFWTACERFRHIDNEMERATQAMAIFSKHLASGSLEPVNVDSHARNLTQEKLQSAERDIFVHAQKQIFNLMKFDSYQRFIRSDLFKSCLEAEEKHLPLPYGADDLDDLLKTNFQQSASSKLKKSASNAEDRRRKSLLPWHRKTRSKSRDRTESELLNKIAAAATSGSNSGLIAPYSKLSHLSSNSLKIASTQNSMSDVHSSRSSLSSFDANTGAGLVCSTANGQTVEVACSLCRVILSDGATTIVQTRNDETVGQLVERLLEKRGLSYKFYDVVANGSSKSIDLQNPAHILAGKEVLIEQRVTFKLDLPDPKVISVKSKPKKQLHEVIRPILHKYNYAMEAVQVLIRDAQSRQLDLSLPVTVADGQRLQIVLVKPPLPAGSAMSDYQNGCSISKFQKPSIPKSVSFPNNVRQAAAAGIGGGISGASNLRNGIGTPQTPQSTLDEITNKVFNELLQSKVEAHVGEKCVAKSNDLCSLKSDDCASETSSIFDRMRRRDSNFAGLKLKSKKKSTSSQHSEETTHSTSNSITITSAATTPTVDIKKPIIAKLKAGVKLQVTERVAENQDELLEGLKRAQLARLEDQRGTEINFELPDFLKNKENLSVAASNLRKARANLSPVNKIAPPSSDEPTATSPAAMQQIERPQPAPRLSITNKNKIGNTTIQTPPTPTSPMKIDDDILSMDGQAMAAPTAINTSNTSSTESADYSGGGDSGGSGSYKGPPPLPPKPKVLPIKPSNWGVSAVCNNKNSVSPVSPTSPPATGVVSIAVALSHSSKIPIDINRKAHMASAEQTTRCAYLEEPSSSFV